MSDQRDPRHGDVGLWRFRLAAWSLALIALAFAQAPGQVATDTKLDLTVDPWGFMARSLTLWDANGAFGQVQNQAYGYLFPMGPFFALGHLAEISPWVTQRLWWSVVLVVAFLGVVVLLGVLDIGVGWTRILAGLAFALSPRMLSVLGASSIEMWPSAVAPWVLVPLVIGLRRGDPRRLAALSALAVALVGGVNAAATFAVIPLAAWWIWLAPRGPRRRALMVWWPPFVLLGTLWWILPLLILGRYSPPFLDYIEAASNTTVAATVVDALRGTSNWVPYVDVNSDAGRLLIGEPLLILNGGLVVVLGILGLSRTDLPWRRFLLAGALTGLVLVTLGHVGSTSGLGSQALRDLLDGALAPLRNTHKFDVLIRLPLVIGLCHAVTRLTAGRLSEDGIRHRPDALAIGMGLLTCAAVLGATVPAWTGHVAPRGSYQSIPGYWNDTGRWIKANAVGTTLVTPATSFGSYAWGRTGDEPLQPLATGPWAVRNVIPLAPGGNIEMLDTLSLALSSGQGSQGLADYLRRSDVGTLVVRNDLDRSGAVASSEAVRSTLTSMPGMERVATFGPTVGGGPVILNGEGGRAFVDEGWRADRPAVEVFAFTGSWSDRRVTVDDRVDALIGGTGSLLALDGLGVTTGRATVFGKDVGDDPPSGTILTDGNRRQETAFGAVHRNRSASLTPQERYRAQRPVHRYDQDQIADWLTVPDLKGARSLTASSSQSDIDAAPRTDPSSHPWAAFDGDVMTAWRPDVSRSTKPSWLRLDLDRPTTISTARISLDLAASETRQLTVTTEDGPRMVTVRGDRPVSVPIGRVDRFEISARSTFLRPVAVSNVVLPGVNLSRPLVLPDIPAEWKSPRAILMQGAEGRVSGCLDDVGGAPRCSDSHAERVEDERVLDREFSLPATTQYSARLRVAPRGGRAVDALLQQDRLLTVSVSSQQTDSPRAGAVALADGAPSTGWVAAVDDTDPTLTVRWVESRRVDTLRLESAPSLAASPASAAVLRFSDGSQQRVRVTNGVARFRAVRTTSVEAHLVADVRRVTLGFDGGVSTLPVGASEVRVDDVDGLPYVPSPEVRTYECGSGPTVQIDGAERASRLVTSARSIYRGETSDALSCGPDTVELAAGSHRVTVTGTDEIRPVDLLLRTPEDRPFASTEAVVTMGHNANPGWTAATSRGRVEPVVVDGWQQAWRTRVSDAPTLVERFSAGSIYHSVLLVGALLALSLIQICLLPSREESRWAVCAPRAPSRGFAAVAGVVAVAVLLAGVPGFIAAVVGVGAVVVTSRRPTAAAGIGAALVGVAMLIAVARPWAGLASWSGSLAAPQLLALAGVSATVAVGLRRPRSLRRMNGTSTTR